MVENLVYLTRNEKGKQQKLNYKNKQQQKHISKVDAEKGTNRVRF